MGQELSYNIDLVTLTNMGAKLASELSEIAPRFASAKATYESLEESKKSLLAAIAGRKEGSESARNRMALCDLEYENHLKALDVARKEFLTEQVVYEVQKKRLDVWQTMMASRREELKKGL